MGSPAIFPLTIENCPEPSHVQPLPESVPLTFQETSPEVRPQQSEPPSGVAKLAEPCQLLTTPFSLLEPLNVPVIGLTEDDGDAAGVAWAMSNSAAPHTATILSRRIDRVCIGPGRARYPTRADRTSDLGRG